MDWAQLIVAFSRVPVAADPALTLPIAPPAHSNVVVPHFEDVSHSLVSQGSHRSFWLKPAERCCHVFPLKGGLLCWSILWLVGLAAVEGTLIKYLTVAEGDCIGSIGSNCWELGILIGALVDEGLIDTEKRITEYLSDFEDTDCDNAYDSESTTE